MQDKKLTHQKSTIEPVGHLNEESFKETSHEADKSKLVTLYPQKVPYSDNYERVQSTRPETSHNAMKIDWYKIGWYGLLFPIPFLILDFLFAAMVNTDSTTGSLSVAVLGFPLILLMTLTAYVMKRYLTERLDKTGVAGEYLFWVSLLFILPTSQLARLFVANELQMSQLPPLWRSVVYILLIVALCIASFSCFAYLLNQRFKNEATRLKILCFLVIIPYAIGLAVMGYKISSTMENLL